MLDTAKLHSARAKDEGHGIMPGDRRGGLSPLNLVIPLTLAIGGVNFRKVASPPPLPSVVMRSVQKSKSTICVHFKIPPNLNKSPLAFHVERLPIKDKNLARALGMHGTLKSRFF